MADKSYFRFLEGFTIILLFQCIGTYLSTTMNLFIPGNLLGLLLLFAALFFKIIPLEKVEAAANLMLDNMMVLFIPLNVGLITILPKLKQEWIAIIISIFGSTLLVMIASAKAVEFMERGRRNVKNISK